MTIRIPTSLRRFLLSTAVLASAGPALAAAPGMPPSTGTPPAVLSHIPGDASAALVVGNLKTFGTQISNLGTRLNLTQRFGIPLPPDLVSFAARNLGITRGLDPTGSAAVVLLHMQPEEFQRIGQTGPKLIFLIPTTDAAGMLSDFSPGAKDADGIEDITLPMMPDRKTFAATVGGKWVAFSHDHDLLQGYVKADNGGAGLDKTIGGLGSGGTGAAALQVFSGNDAVLWLHVPDVQPVVSPLIDMVQERISEGLDLANMSANNAAISAALDKAILKGFYFDTFRAMLRDGQGVMFSLRLNDAGVAYGENLVAKPDSPLGNIISAQSALARDPARALTLAGLPGGGFLFAGAFNIDLSAFAPAIQNFQKTLLADDVVAKDPHAEQIRHLLDAYEQLCQIERGGKMVVLDPPVGGTNGAFNGAVLMDSTDPAKCVQLCVDLYKNKDLVEVMQLVSPSMEMVPTVVPDAVNIKGVKLTKIQVQYKLAAATPDHPLPPNAGQGLEMIKRMYGPDGLTMYIGVVPGKAGAGGGGTGRVLTVFGSEAPVLEGSVAAALGETDELDASPMIAAEKREIPPQAIGVLYAPLSKWMAIMGKFLTDQMQSTGEAAPAWARMMSEMKETPPMMVSVQAHGTMLSAQSHIPVGAITGVLDLVGKARAAGRGAGGVGAGNGMP
ncbi:MAG TPA: hypothetical protein VH253_04715 [Phycisphaerae bacterium]|nr:hypothetical protein [Phycisphaerae bacterium]